MNSKKNEDVHSKISPDKNDKYAAMLLGSLSSKDRNASSESSLTTDKTSPPRKTKRKLENEATRIKTNSKSSKEKKTNSTFGRPPLAPVTARKPTLPTAASRASTPSLNSNDALKLRSNVDNLSTPIAVKKTRRFDQSSKSNVFSAPNDCSPTEQTPSPSRIFDNNVYQTPTADHASIAKSINAANMAAAHLAYSWDSLRLGKDLGSTELKEYFKSIGMMKDNDKITAQETLQIIHSLKVRTCLPPKRSRLNDIAERSPLNFDEYSCYLRDYPNDEETYKKDSKLSMDPLRDESTLHRVDVPYERLGKLYQGMCFQDTDEGVTTRREAHYLSSKACIEKMRMIENSIADLKVKEGRCMKRGLELGMLPVDFSTYIGCTKPEETK